MYIGLILNIISNLAFILSSYIMHYFLGNAMSPSQYGVMGTIITILDLEYLFLNNGIRQTLSGEISGKRYDSIDLIKKSLLIQFLMVGIITIINVAGAGIIAGMLSDESLIRYIRYAAVIVPANGLYVITLGINEGLHQFKESAFAGIIYAFSKLSVIIYVMFVINDAIIGTEIGFLTALFLGTSASAISIFKGRKKLVYKTGRYISIKQYIKQAMNFSIFFIVVSVIMSIDTLIVKGKIADDDMAGFYTGAVNFAKVSYFILSAFVAIIIPIIKKSYLTDGIKKVNEIVTSFLKIILCFVLPITIIISATSDILLQSFYGNEYIAAASVLQMLAFAHFFTGIMAMLNIVISTIEEKYFSSFLAVAIVMLDISLCIILTGTYGINGAAFGGFISTFVGMTISYYHSQNLLDHTLSMQSLIIICSNIILLVTLKCISKLVTINNIFETILFYAIIYIIFILILIIIKVIDIKELYRLLFKKF